MQFVFKRDNLRTVVKTGVIDRARHDVTCEIIFTVASRSGDDSFTENIIFAALEECFKIIGGVDVEFHADFFQVSLRGLGEQRKFLARRVS